MKMPNGSYQPGNASPARIPVPSIAACFTGFSLFFMAVESLNSLDEQQRSLKSGRQIMRSGIRCSSRMIVPDAGTSTEATVLGFAARGRAEQSKDRVGPRHSSRRLVRSVLRIVYETKRALSVDSCPSVTMRVGYLRAEKYSTRTKCTTHTLPAIYLRTKLHTTYL